MRAELSDRDKEHICRAVDVLKDDFCRIASALHAHPEAGGQEHFAVSQLVDFLRERGFEIKRPYCDVETAFRADFNLSGAATFAFLAEYDAIEGMGHCCGHDLIAAASVTAAAAAAAVTADDSAPNIAVIGTPDEEGAGGKISLLDAGGFDDISCAIMCHPGGYTCVGYCSLAGQEVEYIFSGKSSHAIGAAEAGINALDAAVEFYTTVKDTLAKSDTGIKMGMIISEAGTKPNVIPDYAVISTTVRAEDVDTLHSGLDLLESMCQNVAKRHGASCLIKKVGSQYLPMLDDDRLAEWFAGNLEFLGIEHQRKPDAATGSSDIGNLSWKIPALQPTMKMVSAECIVPHSVRFEQAGASMQAQDAMLKAAKAMAMTYVDFASAEK